MKLWFGEKTVNTLFSQVTVAPFAKIFKIEYFKSPVKIFLMHHKIFGL